MNEMIELIKNCQWELANRDLSGEIGQRYKAETRRLISIVKSYKGEIAKCHDIMCLDKAYLHR